MSELTHKRCVPCEEGGSPLTLEQAQDLMEHAPGWTLSDDARKLTRSFVFKDFIKALAFVNAVGKLAEEEWHHPDIMLGWGRVELTFTTHSLRGLAENDFIMAAKVNALETKKSVL
ncbi:4a-hydroxytetrahydrobiopterin dehydratase [Candidatus Parcubacteria bacterium]|nr:4a-hydroxytetrahydrobiopterin dehydratase [Candidatus Parcubacteria bacterium]